MAVAIDFESFYSKQTGISTQGSWHYLQDPACEVYMVAVFGEGIDFVGRPQDFDWGLLQGKVLIAHNLAWDGLVLACLQERGIVPERLKIGGSGCTANLSVFLGAPRNLAGAAKQLLGIDHSKDLRTWMKGKTWADAVAAGKEQELRDYCRRDAQACHAIWEKYSAQWPDHERALAQQTMLMGWRGFRVDAERVEAGIAHLERVKFDAARLIPWADGDSPVLSPKALGEACRAAGITPPPSLSEDDPACEEWERVHGEQYPWVGAMRDYRKANALLEKLKTMRARTRPTDGCMGYGLKYFGASTGRWSGDAGFSVQNLQRGESYGVDLRACIVPRPGHMIITCDLAQIEPRCLAWLVGDQAFLDQIAEGIPLYEAHARNTMSWRGGNLKKEDARLYQLAKARCLAEGTLVLTSRGYVPIEQVGAVDMVWDGDEWVYHQGVVCNGTADAVNLAGEWFTADHLIFIGESETKPAGKISKRELAAILAWRKPPSSDGEDLWKLARAVLNSWAQAWGAFRSMPLSRLLPRVRRCLAQPEIRQDAQMHSMRTESVPANTKPEGMGEANR